MDFFYILGIIGIVLFLGTCITVIATLKTKIKNGFTFENENDLKHNVMLYSVGSFLFLFVMAVILIAFNYAEFHWLEFLIIAAFIEFPVMYVIACIGFPLQTLGVIYSIAYLKQSPNKAIPTVYLILASLSWLIVLYISILCGKSVLVWIL